MQQRFRAFLAENNFFTESVRDYDFDIAYMYQTNVPISRIKTEISAQRQADVSSSEVYRSLRRAGVKPSRREHPTKANVTELHHQGYKVKMIAQMTGYSERQVRNIIKQIKDDKHD